MTSSRVMTMTEYRDYTDGSRAGECDFLDDRPYRPEPGSEPWRQGYCDGWMSAASGQDQALPSEVTR